ncbi:MAG: SUMF1/EgtB/PvdO family nonheme iron enzyme [Hyphomicrobiaceae bacterium]
MAVLFVSHASKDDRLVAGLEQWLRASGFDSIFVDHTGIAGGDKWREALRANARVCRVVVCLVSPSWLASDHCFNEFLSAWYLGRRIVPLFLPPFDTLDDAARKRLAQVKGEDQGLDITACIATDGALDLDRDSAVAGRLRRGLQAAGANMRVGLDPEAFAIDTKLREHPFPGLASFGDEDADAALFYGRSREIAEAMVDLRKIRADGDRRPLVIVGASGAGKSSLLKAGIIPRLRRERPAWLPLRAFRPGADPLLNFAEALTRTLAEFGEREAIGVVRDRLLDAWRSAEREVASRAGPAPRSFGNEAPPDLSSSDAKAPRYRKQGASSEATKLTDAGRDALTDALEAEGARIHTAANLPGATILISVDQAEEIARSESESAEALADYLRAALAIPTSPWQLVFTIRTDSFPELQRHPRFRELEIRSYDLRSIPVFRFDDVVEEPAKRYGVAVDVELIDRLMEDAPRADALPLLAFALQRLWRQYAATGRLTEAQYDNVGGLNGLMEDAASRAMRGMEPESLAALPAGALPKRLDALGAATFVPALVQINDQGATIRRVARWGSFEPEARDLIDRFERWRLVRKSGEGEDATVEVAHEALFREWSLLNAWLEPERARLEALRSIHVDAAAWDRAKGDKALLNHRGKRLREARSLAKASGFEKQIGDRDQAYLAACRSAQSRSRLLRLGAVALVLGVAGAAYWQEAQLRSLAYWGRDFAGHGLTAKRLAALKPGDSFAECAEVFSNDRSDGKTISKHCPDMVVVPAGAYRMGEKDNSRVVTIAKPFAVSRFTITFDQWDACVAAGGCQSNQRPIDQTWGRGTRPVINVDWHDGQTYVAWLNRMTGTDTYRLLSEAEWEFAARGVTSAGAPHPDYHWGDDIGKGNANCGGCGSQWDDRQTAPVGSFKPNVFGLYDMHGNVWQWVEDCYQDDLADAPSDGTSSKEACRDQPSVRVLRGGSWNDRPEYLRSANRSWYHPVIRSNFVGFRVARTL